MNVTFLIGNGFDLNCGLKSSYGDIYKEYVKQPSSSDVIAKYKKDLWKDIENWGDFEVAMASYMKNFSSEQEFLECLRDFIGFTESFLSKQENGFFDIIDKNIVDAAREEMIRSFKEFHVGITHTLDRLVTSIYPINAIVFNYTDIFDKLLSICQNDIPYAHHIVHIHGKLNDDVTMGMDNIDQIKTDKYKLTRRGRRAFIKSEFNEQYDPNRVSRAERYIKDSNIICVFGMSLGESDLRWRKQIIEWLETKADANLFLYQYHCSTLPQMRAEQRLDRDDREKEAILKSWGISEESYESYYDRIHIPCCKNIFNIKDAIEKETIRLEKIRERNEKRPDEIAQSSRG